MNDERFIHYTEDEIDLREIFKILWKWRYAITGVTLAAMVISGIISLYFIDPVYEASTTVSVSDKKKEIELSSEIQDIVNELGEIPYMNVQSCVQQVKSPNVLQAVIEEMQLPYTRRGFAGMISAEQIKDTNLIKITISDSDPATAAKMANSLRREFVSHVSRINTEQMNKALEIMENDLLQKEEAGLELANNNLKDYKLQSRSIEFLTAQLTQKNLDLGIMQSNLMLSEIERDKLQNEIVQIEKSLKNTPVTLPTTTTADGLLPAEMAGLDIRNGQVVSENINESYTNLMTAYNEKMAALAGVKAAINTARTEIQKLQNEIPDLEAELTKGQIDENKLHNEVTRREKTVNLLTAKIAEIKITGSSNLAEQNIVTVSAAMVPEKPVKPNKMLNIAIAGVLALMLTIFTVFIMEYMRQEDVSKELAVKS